MRRPQCRVGTAGGVADPGAQGKVKQLREGEAVHGKDKQLAGMHVQLERARKEATMEHTRRHLALVKRKHEKWSANNAAKKIGKFLDVAAGRAKDAAEGAGLQRDKEYRRMIRGIGQWFDPVKGEHVPRNLSLFDIRFPQLSSNRAVREWRGYAKEELGVEHQVLEGKIVIAAVPIGGIVDSIGAYMGVKQTTGVTKVVRHDGLQNNSLAHDLPRLSLQHETAQPEPAPPPPAAPVQPEPVPLPPAAPVQPEPVPPPPAAPAQPELVPPPPAAPAQPEPVLAAATSAPAAIRHAAIRAARAPVDNVKAFSKSTKNEAVLAECIGGA
eukprot:jgi/Tetstr1/448686/TSEL_035926.t1